jgi:hypothetical protein
MKKSFYIILIFLLILSGCKKDVTIGTSGNVTLNNIGGYNQQVQTYFVYGFLFSKAKIVSTLDTPAPDITVDNDGTLLNLLLLTNNFKNSFYKVGEYSNEAAAQQAFKSLTSASVSQWVVWADSLKANQIWLYKSGTDHYTKIRIINTVSRDSIPKNFAGCTFEWVFQPDGSLTFSGK